MEIRSSEELNRLDNGNRFIGTPPKMKDSVIRFQGANNVLFCEPGVSLERSSLSFHKNDSLIVLGRSHDSYKLSVSINNRNTLFIGRENYFNGILNIVLSERKHFFVGSDCLFSFGIWVRTADPHLIYDCESKKRRNPSKSVYIGDHVWIGQAAFLLKGTEAASGSIIGAGAIVSGKHIPHNTVWGGNPAKMLSKGIFWDPSCVHAWSQEMTVASMEYDRYVKRMQDRRIDAFIYHADSETAVPFSEIDRTLDRMSTEERLQYLTAYLDDGRHDRFAAE